MMHSRYVNEKIRIDQLNPNDISDTQEQESKTIRDDEYGDADGLSLSFDDAPVEIPKTNFESKHKFYNKNIPLSQHYSSIQCLTSVKIKHEETVVTKGWYSSIHRVIVTNLEISYFCISGL